MLAIKIFRYFIAMKKTCPIFISCLLLTAFVYGQNFGGNPSSIKWQQINTDAVRVIFPKGADSIANRVATITSNLNSKHTSTIGTRLRKVNVVLNTNNTISNAYVQLGPYRSEYYLTQPQDPFSLGSLNWADNLSIHEFRHVQQYSNFNVGISKAASILFGEGGQALFNAMSVPDWFFEGDAVWNETALSKQGRGRLPSFFNPYKSLLLDGKDYSYMKLRNGSYKDLVPNHYDLGYLLVSYGREKYGDSVWNKVTQDAARFKGLIYPLQNAVKRNVGLEYGVFVHDALDYFRRQWKNEMVAKPQWLTKVKYNNVVDYQYAYPSEDGNVIVLKNSYCQIPTFVKLKMDGSEERIATRDIGYDGYFSYRNGKIVYAALQPDKRWANREYSVIRLLDIATKATTTITSKTKYYSPDINKANDQIVVVEADPIKKSILKVIGLDGKVIRSFTEDSTLFYSHPKFSADDSSIYAMARRPDGDMGILEWRLKDNQSRWILAPAHHIVGFPVIINDKLYYTESSGGKDGICMIDLPAGRPVKLATYPTGIYQGFVRDSQVVGSVFTSDGYRLASFPISNNGKGMVQTGYEEIMPLYVQKTLGNQENVTAEATQKYQATRYHKGLHLFNFHTLQPELNEPEYIFTLLGENVLGSFSNELSYRYNKNERSHKLGYTALYGGSYIQPFVNINQTWGREVFYNKDTTFLYNETEAAFGLQLPLNLTSGKTYRYLTLQSSINTDRVRWSGIGKRLLNNLDFNYFNARLNFTSQIQRAAQQIYPRFAQTLLVDYRTIVSKYAAHQWLLSGYLYLPGLTSTHNLVLTAAYHTRDTLQQYTFSNSFPFSRGYTSINFPRMWRLGANYHLPLFYPDFGFGQMVYFRRVRLNLFYDYTQGKSVRTGATFPFSTVGTELYFDTRVWNQLPVTIGFRYSRLLDNEYRGTTQPNQWEIILPVNLFRN